MESKKQTFYRSAGVKIWNSLDKIMPSAFTSPKLTLAAIVQSAIKKSGHSDFGTDSFFEALERLVDSINKETPLHPFGRVYTKGVLVNFLVNRLELVSFWQKHPEVLNEKIKRPLVIMGLPRSGTSFLFNLLACDPVHRVLSNWETTVSQVPPEGNYSFKNDPRRKKGKIFMKIQDHLAPQMKDIHEFHLDGPEECTPLLMQSFADEALATIFHVPTYAKWLKGASFKETYIYHKKVLQTLQWKYPADRWLLKSPSHTQALEDFMAVYPDALVIDIRRDFSECVSSFASLNLAFQSIHSYRGDLKELGAQNLDILATNYQRYEEQKKKFNPSQFISLEYTDLTKDPMASVKAIYEKFELDFSPSAEKEISSFLSLDRKKKRKHKHSPEYFGLTESKIRNRFMK